MEIKIGDSLICKKTLIRKNENVFIAGRTYTVSYLNASGVYVHNDDLHNGADPTLFTFERERKRLWICRICPSKECYNPAIKDYFYTLPQMRKKKLKKLR